jgi:hypothetical protein
LSRNWKYYRNKIKPRNDGAFGTNFLFQPFEPMILLKEYFQLFLSGSVHNKLWKRVQSGPMRIFIPNSCEIYAFFNHVLTFSGCCTDIIVNILDNYRDVFAT